MTQKILVIEDEEIIASMLTDNLQMMGYEVVGAQSGMEGLRKAELFRPDLITLDVMMPGLDGISVLEKIKKNPVTRDIPVILMSVVGNKKELGLKLGAVAFFKKPFDFSNLNEKIQSLTERKSVLVVDDNPDILKLVQVKLGLMGYDVECAENGQELFEKIKINRPDVILMDVVLGEENGLDIINRLKSQKETERIPVISFSGYIDDEVPEKEIVGVEKFLGRDFNPDELAKEVDSFFSKDLMEGRV